MQKPHSLGKEERLKRRKQIETLFASGKRLTVYPVRVSYKLVKDGTPGVKFGVGVSKRFFKKAVDRNRVKRLLREAYRLQKASLAARAEQAGVELLLFLSYSSEEIASFAEISEWTRTILFKMEQKINGEPA